MFDDTNVNCAVLTTFATITGYAVFCISFTYFEDTFVTHDYGTSIFFSKIDCNTYFAVPPMILTLFFP